MHTKNYYHQFRDKGLKSSTLQYQFSAVVNRCTLSILLAKKLFTQMSRSNIFPRLILYIYFIISLLNCFSWSLPPFFKKKLDLRGWITLMSSALGLMQPVLKFVITRNCTQFRITLRSMGSKCDGQRKSLTVQLNSRPVRRTELVRFSCSELFFFRKK